MTEKRVTRETVEFASSPMILKLCALSATPITFYAWSARGVDVEVLYADNDWILCCSFGRRSRGLR